MGLEEAKKAFEEYKEIYKKGVVLKDKNPPNELFEVDKLEISDSFSIACHYHRISDNAFRCENIFSVIKNLEVQS